MGLCIAIKRSILTDPQRKDIHRKEKKKRIFLPAINVKIDTATDVPIEKR